MTQRILFVCLGNICRSPTAEGVFRKMARNGGVDVVIDSAGTGAWHLGQSPDARATAAAAKRGYDLTGQQARKLRAADFGDFDLILAMDSDNLTDIKAVQPAGSTARVHLFLDYAPQQPLRQVPDPYYNDGFEDVVVLIEQACRGLLKSIS